MVRDFRTVGKYHLRVLQSLDRPVVTCELQGTGRDVEVGNCWGGGGQIAWASFRWAWICLGIFFFLPQ
ncbi:hypothetical protein XELAEV_18024974mg [Xenopus laevis]|uniref:Uncharacterized protein n=1 Tax=Xenopus laevis TaxID=8355 RepID=A0A974HLG1_XENLA|nr:hypothetical protein XELAEV_18024974mg [Xenopus laevis]